MALTALDKIQAALASQIGGWPALAGVTIVTDRSEAEALADAEIDAIGIGCSGVDYDEPDHHGTMRHRAIYLIEVITRNSAIAQYDPRGREIVAHIVAAIESDFTLGGRAEYALAKGSSFGGRNGPDIGGIGLDLAIAFRTPTADHFTIIGQGGVTF